MFDNIITRRLTADTPELLTCPRTNRLILLASESFIVQAFESTKVPTGLHISAEIGSKLILEEYPPLADSDIRICSSFADQNRQKPLEIVLFNFRFKSKNIPRYYPIGYISAEISADVVQEPELR